MNGGMAEIRNQSRNELPLIFPITPAARPKKKAMTRNGTGALEQRSHRPEDGDDRHDRDDEPGNGRDDADDELEQDPRREGEDHDGQYSGPEGGAGLLVLHTP